jgi:hypothetical protein
MTPPRLTEVECPECHRTTWIIEGSFFPLPRPDPVQIMLLFRHRLLESAGEGKDHAVAGRDPALVEASEVFGISRGSRVLRGPSSARTPGQIHGSPSRGFVSIAL